MGKEFIPRMIIFTCSHCSLSGVNSAGAMGLQYPASTRIISGECTGEIDENTILEALGTADGVLIVGCPDGDCYHGIGSKEEKKRVEKCRYMLSAVGLGDERLKFEEIYASDGEKFARTVNGDV